MDTLILPFMFSSLIAPKINSASGSTSALIVLTAWSTSNNLMSLPPVMLTPGMKDNFEDSVYEIRKSLDIMDERVVSV